MSEPSTKSKKLQWKWIGISIVMYALLYLLPLLLLIRFADVFGAIWVFAGIVLVSALAGYLSEGVTIVEPAIAGAGLMALFFLGLILFTPRQIKMEGIWLPITITVVGVFLLSLLGSWLGERAQKLWRAKPTEQVPKE